MEEISSTFPFQDGLLHFSPISAAHQQTKQQPSDHINNPMLLFDLLKETTNHTDTNNHHQERKIMRRDVERQRRKEMGTLYKSLITLIPYDYIKGKRSTSDRLQETVRYVKDLKKRVEKARERREELKGVIMEAQQPPDCSLLLFQAGVQVPASSSSSSLIMKGNHNDDESSGDDEEDEMSRVMVKQCGAGVEVTLNSAVPQEGRGVSLSKILRVLVGQGLSVNSCCSIKANDRILQTIQAEVIGGGIVDSTQLEEKLSLLVHNYGLFLT